ncbi:Alg9-like mannosyltransferase family-domain-containing protein [Lipomyces japonicus]|uniref:Alg9-like mannosyltransferase family-domain-containing protein n=1 Tax=Lipomyces japonicus TaxID=56871 RepID=UPI0034CEDFC7
MTKLVKADPRLGLDGTTGFLHLSIAFSAVLVVRCLCAQYSVIPDCDEVFNYWEPTHYITHGFGLETWEYSPLYAIRSWTYVFIHAAIISLCSKVGISKVNLFFALRTILGAFCAFCEVTLYSAIYRNISKNVAQLFLIFSIAATGMFHASVAYLPSSFSMYFTMLAFSHILDKRSIYKPQSALFFFAVSSFLGWPFALAVSIPFVFEILWSVIISPLRAKITIGLFKTALYCTILLAIIVTIDSKAYRTLQVVPFNIVFYNVFGEDGTGPNIFGTEPWSYYIFNLVLNFSILAVFAYAVIAVILARFICRRSRAWLYPYISTKRLLVFTTPFLLWSGIFFSQPHKEERFFYVVYPLLSFNASIFVDFLLSVLQLLLNKASIPGLTAERWINKLKFLILIVSVVSLFSRTVALHKFYFAPIAVYNELTKTAETSTFLQNVCVGKEWYRYPSSYFLGPEMRYKFIKSDFNGLLPSEFAEGVGYNGTWMIPEGMNNKNKENLNFYVDVSECDYLVDSNFPKSDIGASFEEDYIGDQENWSVVACFPFIDSERSKLISRIIKLPDVVERKIALNRYYERKWTDYCLLSRRKSLS